MTLPTTLRLDRLELRNFRCFAQCSIDLHPELTVLVAENGRGKTAVLDAIGISLGLFVDTIAINGQTHGFERSDVRLAKNTDERMSPVLPVELKASGSADGARLSWGRAVNRLGKERVRTSNRDAQTLVAAAEGFRQRLTGFAGGEREQPPPLPLVAFYGTGRLWSEHRLTERKRGTGQSTMGRVAGYLDSLSSSSSFKTFADWYERMSNAARSTTSVALGPTERPEKLLAAVRDATRIVLEPTRWRDIDWEFPTLDENGQPQAEGYLVVEHPDHGRLPLSVLSDGVRNMIALVADLAHRCARLNPQFGEKAAELTPGILLIDEVDMHLHPRWQQLVVGLLQRAFPAMQLVVSTHSPHVLSTVDVNCIRVIRIVDGVGVLETPKFQTKGVESADVLAAIMGVDPIPQVPEAKELSEYRSLIEDGASETPRMLELRSKLLEHFGHDHPLMLDCDRLLRFQAFKRSRKATDNASN
jgi:predicted ATP-binding protein involved in virulence